ncbi:MAG: ROK family protein [Lapillicoccus sp.]
MVVAREMPAPSLRSPALVEGSGQLLQLVRSGRASTVTELATAMGVSRSTVMQRLDFLIEDGLVASHGATTGSRGRPAATTVFVADAALVLAAQIGLTGCRIAATDLGGEVLGERYLTVDFATGPEALLTGLQDTFDDLLTDLGRRATEVAGLGIGIPSDVELRAYARGLGRDAADWDRGYFERHLWTRYGAPVFLDLDVNLLALAEWRQSWPDVEVLVCVKLGTLIDAAIVVNGLPIRGVSGLAGELGHIKVSGSTTPCSCGGTGCLDAVASGHALVAQLAAAGFEVEHVADVVRLAHQGHAEAIRAVRDAGRLIGEALSSVVNLLNPAVIATWGYLTQAEAPLFAGIREGLYQRALPSSSDNLHLVRASLGDLAGVRGAAMRVIDEVLAPSEVDLSVASRSWARRWPGAQDSATA